MGNENHCSGCEKEFQDGEIIARSIEGNYHHFLEAQKVGETIPFSCSRKKAVAHNGLIAWDKAIYYKGILYDSDKISKLSKEEQEKLELQINKSETGHIILGNLESLAK